MMTLKFFDRYRAAVAAHGLTMKKRIHRSVEFDALNMRTARDIRCRGPVLNLGDAPQKWRINATVVVDTGAGELHHHFTFTPSARVPLAMLNRLVADELLAADYDSGAVTAIHVRAEIL